MRSCAVRFSRLLFQKSVDVFHIVQRVVNEELELGYDAELVFDFLAEAETNVLGVGSDGPDDGVLVVVWRQIDAQICAGNGKVGGDGRICDGDHTTIYVCAVLQEDIGQLLLEK